MESEEVPKPSDSGSDGQQERGEANQKFELAQPFPAPIATTIAGLAASNSRAFGGETTSKLVAGVASHFANELENNRQELAKLRKSCESLREELAEERVRSAVLSERIESFRSTGHLKNVGIAIGTLILGFGGQQAQEGNTVSGIGVIIVGSLIVLLSWFSVPKRGDQ